MVKYTCNLDWFEQILIGEIPNFDSEREEYVFNADRIAIVKRKKGSKHFKYSYDIIIDGRKFAKMQMKPRHTEIMPDNFMMFQMKNNVLYEVGWLDDVRELYKYFGWEVRNNTRMDIALDGTGFMEIFGRYNREEVDKVGRATFTCYKTGNREITGYDIGRKASHKMVGVYPKEKELEKSNKYYIKEFWDSTDLDRSEPVERLELRLRNEAMKQIQGFDWERLDDFEYLASILRTGMENFAEFVALDGDSNLSRRKRIEFIDWESIGGILLEFCSTRETNEIYRLKLSAKTMYWIYLSTGKEHYLQLCREIVMNINCLDWFLEKYQWWESEYKAKRLDYIPEFRTYDFGEQLRLYKEHKTTHVAA